MYLLISGKLLLPALAWVVLSDLLYRRIPNWLVLGLLLLCVGTGLALGWRGGWHALPPGLGQGGLIAMFVLVSGYALFAMRWVGAGDVKLVAVLSVWFGAEAPLFLMATSLAGGVLALGIPLVRMAELALAKAVVGVRMALPFLRIPLPVCLGNDYVAGLPYGLAIAVGAACVLL